MLALPMLNCSTLFMYLGRSVTMVKKPQSWPTCATASPHTGSEVRMPNHGVGAIRCNSTGTESTESASSAV